MINSIELECRKRLVGLSVCDMHDYSFGLPEYFHGYDGFTWRVIPNSQQVLPIKGGSKIIQDEQRPHDEDFVYTNKMLVVRRVRDNGTFECIWSYDDRKIGIVSLEMVKL